MNNLLLPILLTALKNMLEALIFVPAQSLYPVFFMLTNE